MNLLKGAIETIMNLIKDRIQTWDRKQALSTAKELGILAAVISIISLFAYAVNGIYPFGEQSIARGDMVQQTIPNGMYYVWDILHGKVSPFFTWNSAFGMDLSGACSLSSMLCPLNLLLFFCPRGAIYYFANFFVILKMIGIAFAMCFYLRRYKLPAILPIIGSAVYAFGAASLVHFQIMMVMDAAFFLPLLMIGLDRLIELKRSRFFIITLALAMISNVYTGCILCVFLFMTSGLRILAAPWEQEENRRNTVLRLFLAVLAGCLLSAVVAIPALHSITSTSRYQTGGLFQTYQNVLKATWSDWDWKSVQRMVVNMSLPLAAIVYFLFTGKGTIKEKERTYRAQIWRLIFLAVSVIVPGTELLWHGGSRAMWPLRFIYVITFSLIDFAFRLIADNNEKNTIPATKEVRKKRWLYLATAAGAVTIVMAFIWKKLYTGYCENPDYATLQDGYLCIAVEIIFLLVYIVFFKIKQARWVIALLLCTELVGTTIISYAPNKDNYTVFDATYLEAANNLGNSLDEDTEPFERIKNMDYKIDHMEYSIVAGKQAISNYWHVINPDLQPMFSSLGYTINWTQLLDTGGTIFSDSLFQIKNAFSERELPPLLYDKVKDVDGGENDSLSLYKLKLQFPFAVQSNVGSLEASYDKFAAQNDLFHAVSGNEQPLITDISGQIQNGAATLTIGETPQVLYFYGTNTSENPVIVYVNGNPVKIPSSSNYENEQYPSDFCNGLVCLGAFQNETVLIQFASNAAVTDLHLGMLDYTLLEQTADTIKSQGMQISDLKQKHSGASFTVKKAKEGSVFIPVGYDENWKCKVNGEDVTEKVSSIDGMMTIPVKEGTNEISLHYQAEGRTLGGIITVVTILICLGAWFLRQKEGFGLPLRKIRNGAAWLVFIVFVLAFAAFILAMFVIPAGYYRQTLSQMEDVN